MVSVFAIVQAGRLSMEALLLAASRRHSGMAHRLTFLMPEGGPLWPQAPEPPQKTRDALRDLGADIVPFRSRIFGAAYPHGNKIEALAAFAPGTPILFLDTDTLILAPFDPDEVATAPPSASLNRSNSWPKVPDAAARDRVWRALYDRFGLDIADSLDPARPEEDWARYLYFNAGWFHAPCAPRFGEIYRQFAAAIWRDPGAALAEQSLEPWLDQIALPLAVHAEGGGRESPLRAQLDGEATCHYRWLPLLYARASDAAVETLEHCASLPEVRPLLQTYGPARRLIFEGEGARIRELFQREGLPTDEATLRKRLRAEGVWMR
ncbi:MAG: hypothetical protein AAFQ51_11245 [Pseudomonadota bacterium]